MVVNVNESVILNVVDMNPTIQIEEEIISLNVLSGGLVPSGTSDITLIAGQNLSALRVVTMDAGGQAIYASNTTLANATVLGVTTTSATAGTSVTIATSGLITDGNWTWTKGPVFLGTNGAITQVAPTGGAVLVHVGRALNATTIIIDTDITIKTI